MKRQLSWIGVVLAVALLPACEWFAGGNTTAGGERLSCAAVERARRGFDVEVLEYDASRFGSAPAYSNRVVLRVTNGSDVTLPALTVYLHRLDASGARIGGSRAPAVPVHSVAPGDTVEVEHYFAGWLPQATTAHVEVEDVIAPNAREFFDELEGCR